MRACVVTCGGICPGLNDVVRKIVTTLRHNYGVHTIYGVQNGYKGFYSYDWLELTPANTKDWHKMGGTCIGATRGGRTWDMPPFPRAEA